MRTIFLLCCALPVLCFGQSSSKEVVSQQHQQAVQQLQRQLPAAKVVDVAALAAQQQQEHKACSSCAQKKTRSTSASKGNAPIASKADLIAKRDHLVSTIKSLMEAEPVDQGLLKKYRQALTLTMADLEAVELQEAKATYRQERIRQKRQ